MYINDHKQLPKQCNKLLGLKVKIWMFNATFNNISAILWQSFLWWKPPTNLPQITDKLDHKVVLSVTDKGGNQKREIIKLPM